MLIFACVYLLVYRLTVMAKLSPGGGYREFTSCRFYSFSILWGFVYLHARLNNWTHLILFKNMNIEWTRHENSSQIPPPIHGLVICCSSIFGKVICCYMFFYIVFCSCGVFLFRLAIPPSLKFQLPYIDLTPLQLQIVDRFIEYIVTFSIVNRSIEYIVMRR